MNTQHRNLRQFSLLLLTIPPPTHNICDFKVMGKVAKGNGDLLKTFSAPKNLEMKFLMSES